MAINARHVCFSNFSVDGVPKRVSQGAGLWAVMRANCPDAQVRRMRRHGSVDGHITRQPCFQHH
jgi:hypothetical protein